jgi:hypothetical protein
MTRCGRLACSNVDTRFIEPRTHDGPLTSIIAV